MQAMTRCLQGQKIIQIIQIKQLHAFDAGEAHVKARLLPAVSAFTKGPLVTKHRTLPAVALLAGQIATFAPHVWWWQVLT